jgi:hypothetical protein
MPTAPHVHHWQLTHYLLISLPDDQGRAARCLAWHCTRCGEPNGWLGPLPLGTPLGTPETWYAQQAEQQARGGPEARQAMLEQAQRRYP